MLFRSAASGGSAARGKARSGWGVRAERAAERLGCGGVPGPEGGVARAGGVRPGTGCGRAEQRSGKEREKGERRKEKKREKNGKRENKKKRREREKKRDSRRAIQRRPRRRSGTRGCCVRVPRLWREVACADRGKQRDGMETGFGCRDKGKILGVRVQVLGGFELYDENFCK